MRRLLILALMALFLPGLVSGVAVSVAAGYEAQRLEEGFAEERIAWDCYTPDWGDAGPATGWRYADRVCEISGVKP